MRAFTSLLLIGLALTTALPAAAAITVADTADWPLTPYYCAGGESLDVRFLPGRDYATIDQMDERILMRQVRSASGARYKASHSAYSHVAGHQGRKRNPV